MLEQAILASALIFNPVTDNAINFDSISKIEIPNRALTEEERDKIWREIHFTVQKMKFSLIQAEYFAKKIHEFDQKEAAVAAIQGAILGLSGGSPYSVIISSCLNTLAQIAGKKYCCYKKAKDYVLEAEFFAYHADELEERLWRDE